MPMQTCVPVESASSLAVWLHTSSALANHEEAAASRTSCALPWPGMLMLMQPCHVRWLMIPSACRNMKALLVEHMAIAEVTKGRMRWQLDLLPVCEDFSPD